MNPEMDDVASLGRLQTGPSPRGISIPEFVKRYVGSGVIEPVWMNSLGGLTFRVTDKNKNLFIKWAPIDSGLDLELERAKMEWAIAYTPVPKVVESGRDSAGAWLISEAIKAESAVSEKWKTEPAIAVAAIGYGLRAMHDALPVELCPFAWSAEERISKARQRVVSGITLPGQWREEFRGLSPETVLAQLDSPPMADQLVVCHGDACAPNTLIGSEGQWAGHVDLERLGVGERWSDIAIASWSTEWNYGPGWDGLLYDSYGISPDPERINFYRLLWDLNE